METTNHPDLKHVKCHESVLALVRALEKQGLTAEVMRNSVLAKNPAGAPDESEPLGQLLSPGIQQEVICLPNDDDGDLWWFWCWTGPERGSPPELERICPAVDAELAAARIASVVAVPFATSPEVLQGDG
jgi:hypothetical protein